MKFLFDFLVLENLDSMLLKLCELISQVFVFQGCTMVWFYELHYREKQFTAICCAIHRNELHTDILNSGYLLSGTCCRKLSVCLTHIFLHFGQFYFYSIQVCDKRLHGFNSWQWSNLAWNSSTLTIYFSILPPCGLQLPFRETPWFSFRHWETDRMFLTMCVFEKL